MPIGFFAEGLPVPKVEGWAPVGASRLEWGVPNSSTDFDLLLLEQVLVDNDIPCQFFPHRPNEGGVATVIPQGVWLYVPLACAEQAEQLAEELATAPLLEDAGESGLEGAAEDDPYTQENSR
jgi:hypothetical protein